MTETLWQLQLELRLRQLLAELLRKEPAYIFTANNQAGVW